MIEVVTAQGAELVTVVRALFREYADAIGVDLGYQQFAAELAGLPSPYEPPHGALLIARSSDYIAGCVALRRLDALAGEMKRLYVRPEYRSFGVGRRLVEAAILAARRASYSGWTRCTPWPQRKGSTGNSDSPRFLLITTATSRARGFMRSL
jgi:putative acetyltransferase